jgi:transposase-like protein
LPAGERESSPKGPNRRNGRSKKTVRNETGDLTISTPRDRDGTFEPQVIGKYQRRVPGFDEKILALYAKGMTTRDIQEIVRDLYGVDVSATLISEITADLDAEVGVWRTRPIDALWPIVYFDGLVTYVRGANGRVAQHTIYVAIGVNMEGRKELLGLWVGETEGAKFWLACLTDLKNRGLQDIFVACIDGLSGFAEAIHAAYPRTSVQLCIVHLVRAALRYVSTEDSQAVARDLKKIYTSATVIEAEQALEEFAQAWDAKYPTISKMWRLKWRDIATLFDYPPAIRKAIYTTNAIESVNSVIRKFTRNRKIYPNEDSALKLIYMAIREASRRWTMPVRHWKEALNHFAIMFEGRMPELTRK